MLLSDLSTWAVLAWGIAGLWMVVLVFFTVAVRKQLSLRPLAGPPETQDVPRLSVLVAARNESKCIETCIRSVFRQDYPNFEVIAINDRSTDDTGEILDRLETEFAGRLKVVHVTNLLSGWFGKPHALNLGLLHATGSVVCFTDADVEFGVPSALRTAASQLSHRNLDMLSVAARYTMTSLRESVIVPCCSEMVLSWLRPERIEDPNWPEAFANGAFLMVRKTQFDRIGGWGAVRTKITEDLELARLAKRSGLRVGLIQGVGFYQTDAYATVRDSWNGWSRIFKGVLTPARLLITVGRMSVMFGLPFAATLWGVCDTLRTGNPEWFLGGAGLGFAVAYGFRTMLDFAMFWMVGAPVMAAPLAPLGRLFVMAAAMRAFFSHAGLAKTHWRGSTFSAGQLVMPRPAKPGHQIQ